MKCPVCTGEIEQTSGVGRPKTYCSEVCRRLAEHRLRSLSKRIDTTEISLRELRGGGGYWPDDSRQQRMRLLKRWLAQDDAELRKLLGQNDQNPVKIFKKTLNKQSKGARKT